MLPSPPEPKRKMIHPRCAASPDAYSTGISLRRDGLFGHARPFAENACRIPCNSSPIGPDQPGNIRLSSAMPTSSTRPGREGTGRTPASGPAPGPGLQPGGEARHSLTNRVSDAWFLAPGPRRRPAAKLSVAYQPALTWPGKHKSVARIAHVRLTST